MRLKYSIHENYLRALNRKYHPLSLPCRISMSENDDMPTVEISDFERDLVDNRSFYIDVAPKSFDDIPVVIKESPRLLPIGATKVIDFEDGNGKTYIKISLILSDVEFNVGILRSTKDYYRVIKDGFLNTVYIHSNVVRRPTDHNIKGEIYEVEPQFVSFIFDGY